MAMWVCLCLTLVTAVAAQDPPVVCRVSLMLVIDESGSVVNDKPYGDPENWEDIKRFLSDLIQRLEIGTDHTMIGLVKFGERAHREFAIGIKTKQEMIDHANSLEYSGGRTNTNGGLVLAETMFEEYGQRDAQKVILLITDGKATVALNANLTTTVQRLKQNRVRILGVGVTDQVDEAEMRSIVSDPQEDYKEISQFDELAGELEDIVQGVCRQIECPGTKVYSTCILDNCTRTCENPDPASAQPPVCGTECRSGCACPDVRPIEFPGDLCSTLDSCECEGARVYSTCVYDNCDLTCNDPDPDCGTVCHPGCICPTATPYAFENNQCGTADDCPTGECVIDLFFAVDESGSISADSPVNNWPIMVDFIVGVISSLQVGAPYTRVAMTLFGDDAREVFRLNTYFNKGDMIDAVNAIDCRCHEGGFTNTTGALRFTRQNFFNEASGDRPDVQNVMLLITDGNDNRENGSLMDEVNRLKDMNVRIMAVGVTNQTDEEELRRVVTDPTRDYFEVDQFAELLFLLDELIEKTCRSEEPSCPPPIPREYVAAFSAYISHDEITVNSLSIVIFDSVYTNIGDHYNTATGVFTCPCKGLYLFFHEWNRIDHGLGTAIIHSGDVKAPLAYVSAHGAMSTTTVFECNIGEQVYVEVVAMASNGMIICTHDRGATTGFGGYLIAALP